MYIVKHYFTDHGQLVKLAQVEGLWRDVQLITFIICKTLTLIVIVMIT